MMTNAPTSLKLWSERWKRPSERRSSHSKGSSYCREFTTTLMSYYCRTESNSLFLTQVKNTNVFLTCHCYILIWKYTWECNILYTGLEYFYTATFSLSGEWSAHSFFFKVAIFPVQSAQQLRVIVCMIMLLVFWDLINSSYSVWNEYPHRLISVLQIIPLMSYSDCILHNCCLLL